MVSVEVGLDCNQGHTCTVQKATWLVPTRPATTHVLMRTLNNPAGRESLFEVVFSHDAGQARCTKVSDVKAELPVRLCSSFHAAALSPPRTQEHGRVCALLLVRRALFSER